MSGVKRITKELHQLKTEPDDGITVDLAAEENIYDWNVEMKGPDGSPYSSGVFKLRLHFPENYPFKPPTLNFATKIYHPNVSNDDKGSMCLGILRPDEWKPSSKVADVLRFARQLLSEPVPDDAVEQSIAKEYKDDRTKFNKTAAEWTKKHAK